MTADNISLRSPQVINELPAPAEASQTPAQDSDTHAVQSAPQAEHPPLPNKVKQRIIRGKYIDLDTLLPESLYPARHGVSPSPSFTLRLSNDPASTDGDVVIAQQKPGTKRTIRDLTSWMEAWNVYIQVLVHHSPARAPALLAYQRIICDANVRFAPRCWLCYDQRFRAGAAADKTIRWDRKHNNLWLECFTQPSTQSQVQPPANQQPAPIGAKICRPCT